MAKESGFDVIEINDKQDIPIVKIMEYSKFRYQMRKRKQERKANQHEVKLKEIRFGPNTDEHDFNFKVKHAEKFLEKGNKVKAFVHFRGRSIVHPERGKKILLEFAQKLLNIGKVENLPKMEGRRMHLILTPK